MAQAGQPILWFHTLGSRVAGWQGQPQGSLDGFMCWKPRSVVGKGGHKVARVVCEPGNQECLVGISNPSNPELSSATSDPSLHCTRSETLQYSFTIILGTRTTPVKGRAECSAHAVKVPNDGDVPNSKGERKAYGGMISAQD